MKKLLLAVVVLGLLLVVADRGASALAERAVAQQLAESGLGVTPAVEIRGVPFLTQAIAGRYDEVVVTARDVPAGELRFARFEATMTGLRIPLSQALSGSVSAVPVEALRAMALIPYDEFARRAEAADVRVEPMGDRVEVTGTVEVLDRTLSASTVSRVELDRGEVLITAESFDVGNETVSGVITRALNGKLDFRVPIQDLPYRLVPSGLDVTPDGILVEAFASDTVLTPR